MIPEALPRCSPLSPPPSLLSSSLPFRGEWNTVRRAVASTLELCRQMTSTLSAGNATHHPSAGGLGGGLGGGGGGGGATTATVMSVSGPMRDSDGVPHALRSFVEPQAGMVYVLAAHEAWRAALERQHHVLLCQLRDPTVSDGIAPVGAIAGVGGGAESRRSLAVSAVEHNSLMNPMLEPQRERERERERAGDRLGFVDKARMMMIMMMRTMRTMRTTAPCVARGWMATLGVAR